jgi:TFIIF-interacting CTD phosphatase-like protein
MIVILDIDETLIHSVKESNSIPSDIPSFSISGFRVLKRPYLDQFLENLMNDEYYDIGIWSAGTYDYVHEIANNIITDKSKLKFILTRNDCNEMMCKPLSKVRNHIKQGERGTLFPRSVHDFILIDDRDGVTGYDHLNHLKIEPFEGDSDDMELYHLWEYLDQNRYHTSEYLVTNWK